MGFEFGAWAQSPYSTQLTSKEEHALLDRLARFYDEAGFTKSHRSRVIDERVPKFSAWSGRPLRVNPELAGHHVSSRDPLVRLAGEKATPGYKHFRCKTFWKNFKGQECGNAQTNAVILSGDDVEDLAHSWLAPSQIVREMGQLPDEGRLNSQPWSGDYWRTRWGLTSYRYSTGAKYPTYEQAVAAYQQPSEWDGLLSVLSLPETIAKVHAWSPAEKYDLLTGNETFPLTNEQKHEGKALIGEDGKVEDWYGLCHGWAPAALVTPPAIKPVKAIGARGIPLTFTPYEIRGLVALAWSNGDYDTTFAGGRCDTEKPRRHPNGRLINQDCFDTNPATLHLSLANLIGKAGVGFVIDAAFDAEISNQPVLSYAFQYFNPLDPTKLETSWEKAVIPYDDAFKKVDRFQSPLSRGYKKDKTYSDERIKKIVGVALTLVYLDESDARPGTNPIANETVRVTYTYDLELEEKAGKWVPTGGEWHSNSHPDFLWMVEKNAYPHLPVDDLEVGTVSLVSPPTDSLQRAAEKASRVEAYPLCKLVKSLVEGSENGVYSCQ